MSCNIDKIEQVYKDTGDIGLTHDVMIRVAQLKREVELDATGDRFGAYLAPSEKLEQYAGNVDAMIGKTVEVIDRTSGAIKAIKVSTVDYVAEDIVQINKDQALVVDMTDAIVTSNGSALIKMGSADGRIDGVRINEVNGTMLQNLDTLIATTVAKDGTAMSADFKGYLDTIFNKYKDILMESGKDIQLDVEFLKALDEYSDKDKVQGTASFGPDVDNKVQILLSNVTEYRTNTEVLAEELQHILIRNAMKNNDKIRMEVENLRKAMRDEFNEQFNGDGYKIFLQGKENPSSTDKKIAKKQFDYAFSGKEFPAEEFLAHATTNQAMVRAMLGVTSTSKLRWLSPVEEKGRDGKVRKWAKIWNQLVAMINSVYSSKMFNGTNAQEYAISMLDKLLEFEHKAKQEADKSMYQKLLELVGKGDQRVAEIAEMFSAEGMTKEEYDKTKKARIRKQINKIWEVRALAEAKSFALQNNIFNSINRDMKNKDVARFYEMFRHSKEFVEREVVAFRQRLAKLLDEEYGLGKVDKGLRKMAKRVLIDIDGQVLGDADTIAEYLRSEDLVKQDLDKFTAGLSKEAIQAIDDTAELLVNNTSDNLNVHTNASQIALALTADTSAKAVVAIDKAITLRAMQKMDKGDKALALKAIEQEPDGMNAAMEVMRTEKEEILERAYKGNRLQEVKGAKQEVYKRDKKRYLVDEEEMKGLTKAKLLNLGKHEELSLLMGKNIYTVVGDSLDTRYTEGLLKIVQLSNEGDSLKYTMMKMMDMDEEAADARIAYLHKYQGRGKTTLVPERNGISGEVYDYRVRIPYEDKVKYLGMDDDLVATAAATVANLTHKQRAMADNYVSLKFLRGYYKDYNGTPENKFVEIGPKSTGKLKEYWDIIPYYIKNKIEQEKKPLMVTEAMLVDLFGYHDASIINLPWVKNTKKRQLVAKKFETVVMELIGYFKFQLVAMTPDVIMGNNMSNMVLTMTITNQYNPIAYIAKYKRIWGLMNDYQKTRRDIIDLELRKKTGETGLDSKLKQLNATLKNNPVHVIMEDGQYNVIFEDLNTQYFDNEGMIEGKINEVIGRATKKGKKGKPDRNMLKSVVDTIYMRKESAMHDSVMKATMYSDAISKMMILMESKERAQELHKEGKTYKQIGDELMGASAGEIERLLKEGVMPKTWLAHVDMMYVNYGYLDNKYIKYANDMGGLLFTKYFFRIMPAMAKLLATKSISVIVGEGAQKLTGLDVATPFDPMVSPLTSLARRMSLYTRPEDVLITDSAGPWFRWLFTDKY